MINWWLLAPMLAFLVLAGVFAWIAARKQDVIEDVSAENTKLREELQEAKATVKARDLEIERLQKSADHATVPLAEAAPAKRTTRKPKVEKN